MDEKHLPLISPNRSSGVISRITGNVGTLKTLSNNSKLLKEAKEFVLFTHHKKIQENVPLQKSYTELREAVLELFLSVKIRDDCEIDDYNQSMYRIEKQELENVSGFELIDMIKDAIEKLMNMQEAKREGEEDDDSCYNESDSAQVKQNCLDSAEINFHFQNA